MIKRFKFEYSGESLGKAIAAFLRHGSVDLEQVESITEESSARGSAAAEKIKEQLEWRGPGGKKMGHVVLTREQAEELIRELSGLPSGGVTALK